MAGFERSTAVQQVAENHWRGEIVAGWRIGTAPNGGYILAIAGRVLSQALHHTDPLTMNIMYLAPPRLGPVDCHIQPLRTGGSTSFAALTMLQEGKPVAQVNACFGDVAGLKGESWSSATATRPLIAAAADCPPIREHGIEFRQSVNQCYASGAEVFRRGEPDGSGCFNGWLSLVDESAPDLLTLLLFADAMAPPVFTVFGALQWVPTLELSVSVRAHPAPGPIQARFLSRYMTRGIIEEDGELWDSEGQLVALSRQTSKVRVVKK